MSGPSPPAAPAPWSPRPAGAALAPAEVHVLLVDLEPPEPVLAALEPTLSPDERARAARFVHPADRRRFVAARGGLRALLGGYLARRPAELSFATGAHGKPFLADATLRFNLSHSHGLALLAVADGRELGVDLELLGRRVRHDALAARHFTPAERAALAALPDEERRREAFLRLFTLKEAYLKAVGTGLGGGLGSVEIPRPADAAIELDVPAARPRWHLRTLPPPPDHTAALAFAAQGDAPATVRCWSVAWPELA